jgi:hypothetical protein
MTDRVVASWELEVPTLQQAFRTQKHWHEKALSTWDRVGRAHLSTAALYLRRSHAQPTTLLQCSMRELAFEEARQATRAFRKYHQHQTLLRVLDRSERVAQEVTSG